MIRTTFGHARWWLRNLPHRARGLTAELCRVAGIGIQAELRATVLRADGSRRALGVLSRRMVTNVGAAFIADAFRNLTEIETLNFHDSGTGAAAEAQTDTALGTPAGPARVSGTQSAPTANQYRTVATITYSGSASITEHGLFSASSGGTLLDRSVFASIGVGSGDSIQFTYTLTIPAGG